MDGRPVEFVARTWLTFGLSAPDFLAMFMQHIDLFVSSASEPVQGEYSAGTDAIHEHLVTVIGSSGVYDTWATVVEGFSDLGSFVHLSVEPVPDDSTKVKLKARAAAADKRVGLRVYVLSQ